MKIYNSFAAALLLLISIQVPAQTIRAAGWQGATPAECRENEASERCQLSRCKLAVTWMQQNKACKVFGDAAFVDVICNNPKNDEKMRKQNRDQLQAQANRCYIEVKGGPGQPKDAAAAAE